MEEIDLKEFFATAWNKKVHIIFILIVFAVIGVVYTTKFVTPEYTASTTIILASTNTYITTQGTTADTSTIEKDISLNSRLVSTYSELIKSKKILRQVQDNLNINLDEEKLKKSITVSTVEDTEIIKVEVTLEDSELAKNIANEISVVFMDKIKDLYKIDNVQVIDEAELPDEPSNVNHKRDLIIFIFVGLVVSGIYVILVNMLDTTIKSVEELESLTGLVCLAALPVYEANSVQKKGRDK